MTGGPISGHQRVAAFLLSLDPKVAAALLKRMSDDVVQAVSEAMLDLDPRLAQADAVDGLYRELAVAIHGPKRIRACDRGSLTEILVATFGPQKGREVVDAILARRAIDRPFLAIEGCPPSVLAGVLTQESGAVAAVVLAHLAPSQSAAVLRFYDTDAGADVVRRMATLETPPPGVLRAIATDLEERVEAARDEPRPPEPGARLKSVAQVLSSSSPDMERSVFESLSEQDARMASELREYMFTWNDVATIDKRSMQKILGTVNTKTLSMALKASSPEIEANVLGNLSSRVREMVAEERELAGAVAMSEVELARDEIMRNIRAMIEAGEFTPAKGGEELVT